MRTIRGVHPVGAPVGHRQRLGETFRLVVNPARATGLTLPQYDSGCGCTSGSPYVSEVEASTNRAPFSFARPRACGCRWSHLQRVNGKLEVVDGRRRRREVQQCVHLTDDVDVVADVRPDEPELWSPSGDPRWQALRDEVVEART